MPPTRNPSTKAASGSTRKPKRPSKPRKVPKGLSEIEFCHYGVSVDVFNGEATSTANPPSPTSESVVPLSAATSQDRDDILNALPYFRPVLPSAHPFHAPVSISDFDNVTRVATYCRTEVPILFHGPFQIEAQTADDIPAMSNNMYQSYVQYPNNQLIPQPSSSGSLGMGYDDQPYQQWLLDPNASYSIPLSTSSYVSNASIAPTLYNLNDIHVDVESSMAGSHLAMMSNDGTISSPFPYDNNLYPHL